MEEMIAMQLCGAHVGRTISLEYIKTSPNQEGTGRGPHTSKSRVISKVIHWRNGDVSISQSWDAPRYPFNAKVIFHD